MRPSVRTSRAGRPSASSQSGACLAADDRGRRRDVRIHAGRGRDAHRAPDLRSGTAVAGVDDVMVRGVPTRPPPDGGARGGQAAGCDQHGCAGLGGRVVRVGQPDRPSFGRGVARDGDVATQAHEHAAAGGLRGRAGSAIGREGLGGGAQIQPDAGRDAHARGGRVQLHRAPTGGRHRQAGRRPERGERREVPVVPHPDQRRAHGGIDVAVREDGRAQRHGDGLHQQGRHPDPEAGRGVHAFEVGVGPEAAAGEVDRLQFADDGSHGGVQITGEPRVDVGGRAQGAEGGSGRVPSRASGDGSALPPDAGRGGVSGAWSPPCCDGSPGSCPDLAAADGRAHRRVRRGRRRRVLGAGEHDRDGAGARDRGRRDPPGEARESSQTGIASGDPWVAHACSLAPGAVKPG